ncbi:MAG: alpha-ketoglutarate-dependent dioxygenase AlkB [Gammaproteobacteria bacterium]|nr:alpha-ketoglutarate-dependent dioxygenase AlkB [Gammaproteobacteria bacterium]
MVSGARRQDGFCEIPVSNGTLRLYPRLFSIEASKRYFDDLKRGVDWKSEHITMFGRSVPLPRLTAWFGDAGTRYTYSGLSAEPGDWTPALLRIKARVEEVSAATFNSVLLNYYRDGRDSVSWHSDDEPELGPNPVIGSVSFGSERPFQLRHRTNGADVPGSLREPTRDMLTLGLPNGSYLEMGAGMQRNWMHRLPKRPRLTGERINLTFRTILGRRAESLNADY